MDHTNWVIWLGISSLVYGLYIGRHNINLLCYESEMELYT